MTWGAIGRPGNFSPTLWWGYRFKGESSPAQLGHKVYCRLWRDGFPKPGEVIFQIAKEISDSTSPTPVNVFTWNRSTEGPIDVQRIEWFYFLADDGIEVYHWPSASAFKEHEFEFKVAWGMKPAIMLNYRQLVRINAVKTQGWSGDDEGDGGEVQGTFPLFPT